MRMETETNESEVEVQPEVRLWQAVIASTVEEWAHGPLRGKQEAEEYLFGDKTDFSMVCQSANMNPECLREKLARIRDRMGFDTAFRTIRN
jgi:hypothetical protein